jgi:hypothetical protein
MTADNVNPKPETCFVSNEESDIHMLESQLECPMEDAGDEADSAKLPPKMTTDVEPVDAALPLPKPDTTLGS